MSYRKAFNDLKFDVRMKDFNLTNNIVTKEELSSFENSLQDSAANAEALEIEVETTPAPQQAMDQGFGMGSNVDFGGLGGFGGGNGFGGGQNGGFTFQVLETEFLFLMRAFFFGKVLFLFWACF